MPNIESLDFVYDPIKSGPYQDQQANQALEFSHRSHGPDRLPLLRFKLRFLLNFLIFYFISTE